MTAAPVGVVRSAAATSLVRYSRSWGFWALVLLCPVTARLWIGSGDSTHAAIAVDGRAPVMTSAMLGVSLGVVVSTLLLPVAFVYLRSSTTRRQPWPVIETTAARPSLVVAGRFLADCVVMATALAALAAAGIVLGLLGRSTGGFHPVQLLFALGAVAVPAVMVIAALRALCDAVPATRGALGEVVCLAVWLVAFIVPGAGLETQSGFAANVKDLAGYAGPLLTTLPIGHRDVEIGGNPPVTGPLALDVLQGLTAGGYLAARLVWVGVALALVVLAGLLHRPHRRRSRVRARWWSRIALRARTAAPVVGDPAAPAARPSRHPFPGLLAAEFRLIGAGRAWRAAALVIALVGLVADYRHVAGPAALLVLVFALTAQAARAEQPRYLHLASTTPTGPGARRLAFVLAGTAWTLAMAAPAVVRGLAAGSSEPLVLALVTGGIAAVVAAAGCALTRSAFAARLLLLLAWYVWLSA